MAHRTAEALELGRAYRFASTLRRCTPPIIPTQHAAHLRAPHHPRRRPTRSPHDRPRRGRNPGLHAGRHARGSERRHTAISRPSRRLYHALQPLPSGPPARHRDHRAAIGWNLFWNLFWAGFFTDALFGAEAGGPRESAGTSPALANRLEPLRDSTRLQLARGDTVGRASACRATERGSTSKNRVAPIGRG
jgi:hypothetical protein